MNSIESSLLRQGESTTTTILTGSTSPPRQVWCSMILKVSPILLLLSYITFNLSFHFTTPFSLNSSSSSSSNNIHDIDSIRISSITQDDEINTITKKQQALRGKQTTTTIMPNTITNDVVPQKKKEKIKLSLWLIPPGGEASDNNKEDGNNNNNNNNVYERTKEVIDELAEQYNGPKFIPHVTIVGGIEVDSEEDAMVLSKRLEEGLAWFGNVECNFKDVLQEPSRWNQALIIEMIPSDTFLQLCRFSRKILGLEQQEQGGDCITFPPPAGVPHASLFYGESPPADPDYVSRIFGTSDNSDSDSDSNNNSYQSHRVMLWKTDPSSAEGVPEWEALADISLL